MDDGKLFHVPRIYPTIRGTWHFFYATNSALKLTMAKPLYLHGQPRTRDVHLPAGIKNKLKEKAL